VLGQTETVFQGAFGVAEGGFDQDVAQGGDFRGGLRQGSDAEDIAQHDADVFAALEAGEQQRAVALEGTGAEAGEGFGKIFAGETAVEVLVAEEGLQEVGIAD
jgi:hypothetical protein